MKRGFSLIEVLVGMFVVVIAAMIVGATVPISGSSQLRASDLAKAVNLAQAQLEAVRTVGYKNLDPTHLAAAGLVDSAGTTLSTPCPFSNPGSSTLENPAKVLPSGAGSVKIDQLKADERQITVTIRWNDRGKARSVQVGTLVTNL